MAGHWGFPLNGILRPVRKQPRFNLRIWDTWIKILESLHKLGITSQQAIKDYLSSRDSINDKIKEVLFNLGYKNTVPTPEHQSLYVKWTNNWQMDHDVVLLACKQLIRKKARSSFNQVDELLARWNERGLTKSKDVKNYLNHKELLINEIRAVLERAGDRREVTAADQKVFAKWTKEWNLSYELILLAAEYSTMAENKLTFINKILSNWDKKGITSIQDAKADHEQHVQDRQGMSSGSYEKTG